MQKRASVRVSFSIFNFQFQFRFHPLHAPFDRAENPRRQIHRLRASLRPEAVARAAAAYPATYVVYDLLYTRGKSLMKEPLVRRRPKVHQSIASKGRIYVVEPVAEDGLAFFEAAKENGLGGVVALP